MTKPLLLAYALTLLPAEPDLVAHSKEFRREVGKVADGVHVAVGFGLANAALIEGTDGVLVVDTLESAEVAQEVRAEFRRITRKPVRAIVYTHHHADHVFGARVFAGDDRPEVYAHGSLPREFQRSLTGVRPAVATRSVRMFGMSLDERQVPNVGVGPRLAIGERSTLAYLPPTKTFADRLRVTVAGVEMELQHAPGETDDQLFVWLPQKKVLLCGDNFYRSFPNLYSIRGTPYRRVKSWVESIDRMRDLRPAFLVPGHSRPLSGADAIHKVLTDYRDAIQYVHDQTLRGLNRGRTADELAESVRLPPPLARSPYLQEFYGKVSWSVRAICNGHLGWFDGDATNLLPLPPRERARRMADLAGGEEALLRRAEEAVTRKDYQWALELTGCLLSLRPENRAARAARVRALRGLGEGQGNAPARLYYLTQARETEERKTVRSPARLGRETAHALSLAALFDAMTASLDAEASKDVDRRAVFRFPGEAFTVHVRRGVAEVRPRAGPAPDLEITADANAWKEVLLRLRKLDEALARGEVKVRGDRAAFEAFMGLFGVR